MFKQCFGGLMASSNSSLISCQFNHFSRKRAFSPQRFQTNSKNWVLFHWFEPCVHPWANHRPKRIKYADWPCLSHTLSLRARVGGCLGRDMIKALKITWLFFLKYAATKRWQNAFYSLSCCPKRRKDNAAWVISQDRGERGASNTK